MKQSTEGEFGSKTKRLIIGLAPKIYGQQFFKSVEDKSMQVGIQKINSKASEIDWTGKFLTFIWSYLCKEYIFLAYKKLQAAADQIQYLCI